MSKVRLVPSLALVALCSLGAEVSPASAQAEGVIRGQVVAGVDGSTIAGATVALVRVDNSQATETRADASGAFVLNVVRSGEYRMTASAAGFAAREVRLVLEPREVRSVTISLGVAPVAESIDVVADRSLAGTHSPSSTVLTPERLEQVPAAQRHNLPDAIVTLAPGMIRGHDDFVHIRGHEVALNPLINGVAFWENPHALFSAGVSPEIIETANVMTGGFPAEYGNRFGGVIDIVTKSGSSLRNTGTVAVSAGQEGRGSASGEVGGSRGRWASYVFGSLFRSDRFLSPPAPEALHDTGVGGHALVRIDGNLGGAGMLHTVVMGDGADFEIPRTPIDVELRPLANAEQRTRQQTAIVGWSRASANSLFSASAYQRWSKSELMPASGPLTARADVTRELLTVGTKFDVTRTAERHAFKAGVDVVYLGPREDLTYEYGGYRELTHILGLPHIHIAGNALTFHGRESGGQVSGYVQDSVQLGSRVTADLGVRLDHYDLVVQATHASPRVNVAFQAGRGAVLHASYNRFFVPPPVEGILSGSAGLTQFIAEIGVALPPLAPTVEDQFELGLTTRFPVIDVAVTGYLRTTDNPVHTTVWPDSRVYTYASFDRGEAYGLELKVDAPALARYGVTAYGNYALGRVYLWNPVTGGFVTEADHLTDTNRFLGPMDQTHTATGGVTYDHARSGAWVGATVDYGSGTPIGHGAASHDHGDEDDHDHADAAVAPARVPSHVTGNVSFGVNLLRAVNRGPRLALRVDFENVTNNVYLIAQDSEFSPRQYSIPRLVSATLKVRF